MNSSNMLEGERQSPRIVMKRVMLYEAPEKLKSINKAVIKYYVFHIIIYK
jgi:hypothetical protein